MQHGLVKSIGAPCNVADIKVVVMSMRAMGGAVSFRKVDAEYINNDMIEINGAEVVSGSLVDSRSAFRLCVNRTQLEATMCFGEGEWLEV